MLFIDNEIDEYFTTYHISYSLNGRTSAALHCVKKPKRHFDKTLNADSNDGIFFLSRCVNPDLCHGNAIVL